MKEISELRAKTPSNLINCGSEDKRPKRIKKVVIKKALKFENMKTV